MGSRGRSNIATLAALPSYPVLGSSLDHVYSCYCGSQNDVSYLATKLYLKEAKISVTFIFFNIKKKRKHCPYTSYLTFIDLFLFPKCHATNLLAMLLGSFSIAQCFFNISKDFQKFRLIFLSLLHQALPWHVSVKLLVFSLYCIYT